MEQTVRVYVPATAATLARLLERGELAGERAHTVTAALRERYPDADADELAHVAHTRAAQDALRLLAADAAAPRRRVVVAADVAVVADHPATPGSSVVTLTAPVRRTGLAAVHVDGAGAEEDVAAAVAALPAADAGDADAGRTVEAAEDHELEWFDPSELDHLLSQFRG